MLVICVVHGIMQNASCTHLNLSLLLPLFIACLAACEQRSVGRDRVTLMWVHGFGIMLQHDGVVACRSIGAWCLNTTLLQSAVVLPLSRWSVRLTGWCLQRVQLPLACGDDRATIRSAREGAADIGESSYSHPAASTRNPRALVCIGVEQWMTRKDILFTATATYCIPDVHSLLFIC